MNTSTGSRSSRNIWISLFVIANVLDFATTFVGLNTPGEFGLELNPLVHYFGWPFMITLKIAMVIIISRYCFIHWERVKKSTMPTLAFVTSATLIAAFLNVHLESNPAMAEAVSCISVKFNHVQEILSEQFTTAEVQSILEHCRSR